MIRRKLGDVEVSNSGQCSCHLAAFMGRHPKRRGQRMRVVGVRARGLQGAVRFTWAGKGRGVVGKGKVIRHNASSQGLQSGLAFGLFLCAHAGYHIKCNLCVLYLLELEGTRVRQKVN